MCAGMQQRMSIATRVARTTTKVLLLDEQRATSTARPN